MIPFTYFDQFGKHVSKHACDVVKLEMRGATGMAAGCFWQVHDFAPSYNLTAPADGAVPVKSWPAYAGAPDYKEFKNAEFHLSNGLYVCLSTTEATKTLGTGSNKMAMLQAELLESDTLVLATSVEAGATVAKDIWTNATGPKKLVLIRAANLEGSLKYLQLHAADAANLVTGDKCLASWPLPGTDATPPSPIVQLKFGQGRDVFYRNAAGTALVGCCLTLSLNAITYDVTGLAAGMNVYAEKL